MAAPYFPDLEPDFEQAERFLTLLDEEAEFFTFQTFDDSVQKRRDLNRILHGTLEQHWPTLVDLNRKGAGVYAVINETDGKGRKKENITRVRAVWVDDDHINAVRDFPIEPSLVVETSPGKKHYYWFTSAEVDGVVFKQIMDYLVEQFGHDPNVTDLARVMRLPGTFNMKERKA